MKVRDILAVFNRGIVSRLALARTDVSRVALSAAEQTNWIPRRLGSMMVRPGLGHFGESRGDGAIIPFVYSRDDTAILELSVARLRIWEDGTTLLSRPAVNSMVTNGGFDTDLTGWTDADDAGAASAWISDGGTGGHMSLVGTGYASARRRQQVTVASGDQNKTHALRIFTDRAPVYLRIGTSAGADDIFRQAVLRPGVHSIAFVPTGNFHIEFASPFKYGSRVTDLYVESSGVVQILTPWETVDQCKAVRWQQVGDVVFCAGGDVQQHRIERRPNGSWSVVIYETQDGPFLTENVENIRISTSAISGTATLTSSQAIWTEDHVGALWRLTSQGQLVSSTLTADNTFTNDIRVTGVGDDRKFRVTRSGTWSATVSLQRSVGESGNWVTVATYTTNDSIEYDDELDNVIAFYRIGIETGDYTSGSAVLSLEFSSGSITGIGKIGKYTSPTEVNVLVYKDFGGLTATEVWAEGAWSDKNGWPEAVAVAEGRLWWTGQGRNWASVPDAFTIFDAEIEGDSAPINRQVGEGATGRINWVLPLQRIIVGSDGAEHSIRSNSFDEPVTATNYNSKAPSTYGSAPVPAVAANGRGYFVGRTGVNVFELEYDPQTYDFAALDLGLLAPEVLEAGIVRLGVQLYPDLRLHAVRSDGRVALLIRDAVENILCWVTLETDGVIEDVCVLPAVNEDRVFYRVRRTINGVTVRYHERLALESEARGSTTNRMADSYVTGTGPTYTLTGLDHLNGENVVVWADGKDYGEHLVTGGQLTLADAVTTWCAGLPYTARYKSAKLAGQTQLGLALNQRTRVNKLGLILADTHYQGIRFGPDFDTLDDLPLVENGTETAADQVWDEYDHDMIEFEGDWDTDNRICLEGAAPRPCTVLAASIHIDRSDAD